MGSNDFGRLGSDKWDFWQFGVRSSKVEVLNIC